MDGHRRDIATLTVMLQQFEHHDYPRALQIDRRLDSDEPLSDADWFFLEHTYENLRMLIPIVERNPEYQELTVEILGFYARITTHAADQLERLA